ncbi:MAG: NADH:flavin oxidoreductase [Deltaproteobacteria bacterium]|nr:NADH:flavin oxidoreductase [Deltaproteobacteria bacterium]
MNQAAYTRLFSPLRLDGLRLKNRITMAPLYLGYAAQGGKVSPLLLSHYRLMARSGAALVVVENASITPGGSGGTRTIRVDHNRCLQQLRWLSDAVKEEGALSALQINHAGRFARVNDPVAPSAVPVFDRTPRALLRREIKTIGKQFASAAWRVREAGFDLVELHGGTGYLLSQFVSPRTNLRDDIYGGSLENRMRFPLEVVKRVKDTVGDMPVGYRFLADEWLPDGIGLEESRVFAGALEEAGVAYLSVMGGTYESFFLPEVVERSRKPGYMAPLAETVRREVSVPVIAAGRISTPSLAESILEKGQADLIGLARMLWVDPDWVNKAREGRDASIVKCSPKCNACMELVMQGKPAYCPKWRKEKRTEYRAMFY